jgi:hypothetical protein
MQNVVDILEKLAGITTSLVIVGGLIISITKWGKNLLGSWLNKILKVTLKNEFEPIVKGIENNSKAIKCVLRSDIIKICFGCRSRQFITTKELECLTEANAAYVALNGNSFTRELVEDAISLPIKD